MPKPQNQTTTPADEQPTGDLDGKAAAAAIDAVDAETDASKMASGSVGGVSFEFKRKRAKSIQFRRLLQNGRDLDAIEHLLGRPTFDAIIAAYADEDGDTPNEVLIKDIWPAIDEAVGEGNS